jgi:uncharacterized protein YjiS (DUF1127 family)
MPWTRRRGDAAIIAKLGTNTVRSNRGREPTRDSWLALVHTWYQRRRSHILLSQLDDRLLKDVGLTYCEAEHEANKPFWRP